MFTFAEKMNFLLVNQQKISWLKLKTGFEELKKKSANFG
jgi:hypothetical protein